MLQIFLLSLLLIAFCVALLGVKVLFFKKVFPHFHISGNPQMQKRGIGCVESQDAQARRKSPLAVDMAVRRSHRSPDVEIIKKNQ